MGAHHNESRFNFIGNFRNGGRWTSENQHRRRAVASLLRKSGQIPQLEQGPRLLRMEMRAAARPRNCLQDREDH